MKNDIQEAVRLAELYDEIDEGVRRAMLDSVVTREIPGAMEVWRRIRWAEIRTSKPTRGSKEWREIFNHIADLLASKN